MRMPAGPTVSAPGRTLFSAAALLRDLPTPWEIEPFESCDGERSLVIMTQDAESTTYFVTETPSGLSLSELRDDELRSIGEHLSLRMLMTTLATHLPTPGAFGRAA